MNNCLDLYESSFPRNNLFTECFENNATQEVKDAVFALGPFPLYILTAKFSMADTESC
jgi:hypothetical protein